MKKQPIGVFDSGYGGLTILAELMKALPQYDFIYLGDNSRSPYGSRSFEVVCQYSLEATTTLFAKGCPIVIFACNTASAKALRTIQQTYLPNCGDQTRRVLGVIIPSIEALSEYTKTGCIGIFATEGTVRSNSYVIEIGKHWPNYKIFQEACPQWVPLVENGEIDNPGACYFVERHCKQLMAQNKDIDTVILGCTHYPLLKKEISKHLPGNVKVLSQGEIVAKSLVKYLAVHNDMNEKLSKNGSCEYFTTENAEIFNKYAERFIGKKVNSEKLESIGNHLNANVAKL